MRMVHEDESVTLQDFGAAGVVIDSPTGGAYCPSTFRLIHPDTGALRVVSAATVVPPDPPPRTATFSSLIVFSL